MATLPSDIPKTDRYYRVRVTFEGARHLVGDFHTLTDAKAALAIARGEIARGTFIPRTVQRATAKAEREQARQEAPRSSRRAPPSNNG